MKRERPSAQSGSVLHYTRPDSTAIATIERVETSQPSGRPSEEEGLLRAAFRELHGARLHGFTLLVTLGDRPLAARLTSDVLAEGARRADALRHPERAAAWLRWRVTHELRRRRSSTGPKREERRAALATLGVDAGTFDTLATLSPLDRATLVAGSVERLDERDLEVVLEASAGVVHRQTAAVQRRFLERRAGARAPRESLAEPLLANRIQQIAERALS